MNVGSKSAGFIHTYLHANKVVSYRIVSSDSKTILFVRSKEYLRSRPDDQQLVLTGGVREGGGVIQTLRVVLLSARAQAQGAAACERDSKLHEKVKTKLSLSILSMEFKRAFIDAIGVFKFCEL